MSASDDPAFPTENLKFDESTYKWTGHENQGLTKREYFAAMALPAMIQKTPMLERISFSDGSVTGPPEDVFKSHMAGVARAAVEYADALIVALERKPE
jgi:hypothetical protein